MDAWTRFAESLFRLNGLLIASGESITRPLGQTSARWQVLGGLGYGPKTVADIARDIGHARQSVQRLANTLMEEGLVERSEKPNDRRTSFLRLTPSGQAVLLAIYERQVMWSTRVVQSLDAEQLEALATSLRQIGDIIEADAKTDDLRDLNSPD